MAGATSGLSKFLDKSGILTILACLFLMLPTGGDRL
jgi:hypothetical protein